MPSKKNETDIEKTVNDAAKKGVKRTLPDGRTASGRFAKGHSGNPGGMPPMSKEKRDALQKIRDLAPEAAEIARKMLLDPKTKDVTKVRLIEFVFDRTYGKARQQIDMEANGIPQVVIVGDLLE